MVNMSTTELKGWYNEVDQCMLALGPPDQRRVYYSDDYRRCLGLRKRQEDPLCEGTILCQYAPLTLYQRPLGYGTDDANKANADLLAMFVHLNRTGRSLFFFGDSITRNVITGLRCALWRSNPDVTFNPPFSKEKFGFTSTWVYIPQPAPLPPITSEIFFYALWHPTGSALFKHVSDAVTDVLARPYITGLVVVGNIGLHERHEAKLQEHLEHIFSWAQSPRFGDMPGKSNDFFYRETSIQHFPRSPAGYYQVWIGKNKKGNPNNTCEAFDLINNSTHSSANWRTHAVQAALSTANAYYKAGKTNTPIRWIHFANFSSLLTDVHPSSVLSYERYHFDCTHYCGNVPLVWQVIFHQIYSAPLFPHSSQ